MSKEIEDLGNYFVSVSRNKLGELLLNVESMGSNFHYHQTLPASYGAAPVPSYDIAFFTHAGALAHPLEEMEHHYGLELGSEILLGVFKAAEWEFWNLKAKTGESPANIFATMECAHDVLAVAMQKRKADQS